VQPSGARRKELLLVVVGRLALFGALIWGWDWLVRTGRVSPLLLPPPDAVVRRLWELLQGAELWENLGVTVFDVLAAFALSLVTGLAVGVTVGASRYWSQVVEPLIVAAYTVPIIVIYPVITMLFGIDDMSKIVFAGLYGFFPIAANTIRGLMVVPPGFLDAARALGAQPRQLKWSIMVPAARPLILSGVRIGLSLNLIGVVAGQMLASRDGLGFLISTNAQLLRSEDLYAYIALTFFLAGLVNYVLTRNEQALPRERRSLRPGARRRGATPGDTTGVGGAGTPVGTGISTAAP
jgi:ABC-type nitrate/sulfonate/bicarbonate transport system permease component